MSWTPREGYAEKREEEIQTMVETNHENLRKNADGITVIETTCYVIINKKYYVNVIFNGDLEAAIENYMQACYMDSYPDVTRTAKKMFKSFPGAAKIIEQHALIAALKGEDTYMRDHNQECDLNLIVKGGWQEIRGETTRNP